MRIMQLTQSDIEKLKKGDQVRIISEAEEVHGFIHGTFVDFTIGKDGILCSETEAVFNLQPKDRIILLNSPSWYLNIPKGEIKQNYCPECGGIEEIWCNKGLIPDRQWMELGMSSDVGCICQSKTEFCNKCLGIKGDFKSLKAYVKCFCD